MRLFLQQQPPKDNISSGTKSFLHYINLRIANNKNFLATITGPTGSGKSYAALSFMELLNPDKTPEELMKNVCFDAHEFMERINSGEMATGLVLLWEESGVGLSSKNWQSLANKSINYLLQTFRNMNLIVIFTLPYFTFLDNSSRKLMHSLMQTVGIDKSNQTTLIKPFVLSTSQQTGKMYNPYLRVSSKYNKKKIPVKVISLPKPSERLLQLYEEKKTRFTQKLNDDIEKKLDTAKKKEIKEIDPLTARQRQIMDLYISGNTPQEIADMLNSGVSTIYHTLQAIENKGIDVKKMRNGKENAVFPQNLIKTAPTQYNIGIVQGVHEQ